MRFKKIINICLIVFFIAFSLLLCLNRFNHTPLIEGNNQTLKIYEWWHIESFEGGGANRLNYLKQLSLEYEKSNSTQLFMVKLIEHDQLDEALKFHTPHIISFSEQVAQIVLPYLKSFNSEYNIQDHYLQSATYNGKLMALPFIASGYCYFTKTSSNKQLKLYTANNNMHNALSVLNNEIVNENKILSSYECYTKFINSTDIKLLGTARDLFRIKNLESLGRFNVTYEPVSSFTDLVQYLGITTNNKDVGKFIEFVISDTNQYKLSELNLFSTKHLKLYSDPIYSSMETALQSCHIPNIFTSQLT